MNDDNEQRCYDAGMDAYIFKPFKAADLLRIMQSYLGS
jgi:CheY-like chemotaxis protein